MGRVIARCCALLLGLAAVWWGITSAEEPYRETARFRHAEACTDASAAPPETSDCIGRETGRVTGKRTYMVTTGTTDDSSTSTVYELSIKRASGGREVREVSASLYDAARRGSRADLDVWQGEVVGITVRGVRDRFNPSSAGSLMWVLLIAWAGVGALLWSALGGWLRESAWDTVLRAFAWLFFGMWTLWPVSWIASYGTSGWGLLGWSLAWLFGAAVSVPMMAFRPDRWYGGSGWLWRRRWRKRMRARR